MVDWAKTSAFGWILPFMMALAVLYATVPAHAGGRRAAQSQPQAAAPGAVVRSMGAVEAIHGNTITLKTDSGSEVNLAIQDSTRMLRIQPGQKSLKGAMPLRLQDLQVGDRVLAVGKSSASGNPVLASSIIAIKQSDIAQRQQQEQEEWQKHGVGGLVRSVDASTRAITLMPNAAGKTITVQTSKDTTLRRYAPGSVRFQDAKPGTFGQIKPGDQLRARGILSPEGSEITAAAIVSGSFQNIAGTVISIDPSANEVTVMDLVTKKPVSVNIVPDSELRKLPAPTAQEIAARLKKERAGTSPAAGAGQNPATAAQGSQPPGSKAGGSDLDEILSGLPQISVEDLHKGDAVMIVSTQGAPSAAVTAIKLVSGVAPLLRASPGKGQAKALQSLWSGFGGSGGGGESGGETPAPSSR